MRQRIALSKLRPLSLRTRFTRNISWDSTVKARNPSVNAIVHLAPETSSVPGAPLSNVSVAIKDNICTADMPTTCSSRMLQDFTSPFNATAVDLLLDAGATIIGKTNCDEFGMGYVV